MKKSKSSTAIHGLPEIQTLFREKLCNIHISLMAAYYASKRYPSSIIGVEREVVNRELLSLVLPPGYRVGTGLIVDATGVESRQVDAIVEQPFSLSFPISSNTNRLYLADTVASAFEIKSDLRAQGQEALKQVEATRQLRRRKVSADTVISYDGLFIPTFIIGFKGPRTIEEVERQYMTPMRLTAPTGVLVIESELFVGRSAGGGWFEGTGKSESILAFLSCLVKSLQFASSNHLELFRYANLLQTEAAKVEDEPKPNVEPRSKGKSRKTRPK